MDSGYCLVLCNITLCTIAARGVARKLQRRTKRLPGERKSFNEVQGQSPALGLMLNPRSWKHVSTIATRKPIVGATSARPPVVTWRHGGTWLFDTLGAISYRCPIVTESVCQSSFRDMPQTYRDHDLDLLGSRVVIGHVTIRLPCHFLLVVIGTEPISSTVFNIIIIIIYFQNKWYE